jgi:hypothetical protein
MCRPHRRNNNSQSTTGDDPASRASTDSDLFDDLWSSITDTATELTRSLVGLPMLYRRTHTPDDPVIPVFAEPGILTPSIITFHLDRDVVGFFAPFRFVSRPVTVFDVFTQGQIGAGSETGMMFLFGTPAENHAWLQCPGLSVTRSTLFHRPWASPNEWVRRRTLPNPLLVIPEADCSVRSNACRH